MRQRAAGKAGFRGGRSPQTGEVGETFPRHHPTLPGVVRVPLTRFRFGAFALVAYTVGPLLLVAVLTYAITRNRRARKQGSLAPGTGRAGPRVDEGGRPGKPGDGTSGP
jgi:hypothetical protein